MEELPKQNTQLQNHKGKDYRCYYRKMLNNVNIKDISKIKWCDREKIFETFI